VLTLGAATGLLALAGVDQLDVVDITVRLVEVAVTVVVEPVPLVEARQVLLDLDVGHAGRLGVLVPGVGAVLHEVPVRVGLVDLVRPVPRLVVRHLHPRADITGDGVLAGGLLEVEVGERLPVLAEEHLLVVVLAEVLHPVRGVVLLAVGLGDLVADRPRLTTGTRVGLVAELAQDGEQLVATLHLRLTAQHLLQRGLAVRAPCRLERVGEVVLVTLLHRLTDPPDAGGGDACAAGCSTAPTSRAAAAVATAPLLRFLTAVLPPCGRDRTTMQAPSGDEQAIGGQRRAVTVLRTARAGHAYRLDATGDAPRAGTQARPGPCASGVSASLRRPHHDGHRAAVGG